MLYVKVTVYCVLATVVGSDFDPKRKSIPVAKCSALKDGLLQLISSVQPSASPVAFAVPPSGHSICSEIILSSAAEKSVSPLLVFSHTNQVYHPLAAKVAMTVLIGNPDQISENFGNLRSGYIWDASSIVVTILENNSHLDILRTVRLLQQAFVRRLRVLTPVSDEEVAVWSATDPAASICGRPGGSATLLGIWKSTEVGPHDRFLTKLPEESSLQGMRCTLRVYVTEDEPFSLDENPPRGLDIELLKFLAEKTGFSLEFIMPQANVTLPSHPDDHILVDGLRSVYGDPIDSVVGCVIPTILRSRLLTMVQTYFHNAARIWVRETRSITQPIPSETVYAWPVFFLLWIVIMSLLKLFRSDLNQRTSFLMTWAIMMEVPSPRELLPHSFKSRVFLSLFLMCTFVTNMDLRSSLTSVLTASKTRSEFGSYDDLVASNAVIGFSSDVFLEMFAEGIGGTGHDKAVFIYRRTVNCMGPRWPYCLKKFTAANTEDKSFALFTSSSRVRTMAVMLSRTKMHPSLPHPSFQAMCSMYLRKGSPWAERFRQLIVVAAAADLRSAWFRRSYRKTELLTLKGDENRALCLENFILAFQILGLGLAAASAMLFLELLFSQYRYRLVSVFQFVIHFF